MKKIIVTLLFLIPFLTGCASVNTNLTINNNKSASVSVDLISRDQISPFEILTIKQNYKKFIDDKYNVADNSTSKKLDYSAVKNVKNLSKEDIDLSSLGFKTQLESGRFVDVKHNFFVTSYNIHMIYDFSNQLSKVVLVKENGRKENAGLHPEYLQKYADKSDIVTDFETAKVDFLENFQDNFVSEDDREETKTKEIDVEDDYVPFDINNLKTNFTITLPMPASYNNADENINNIYLWQLKKDRPTEIKLQYVVYSGFAISFLILVGILLLVYIARRVSRHDRLKRIGNNN